MHKYMRAIGFSKVTDRKELQKLITDVIINGNERSYTSNGNDTLLAEFCKDFTKNSENGTGFEWHIYVEEALDFQRSCATHMENNSLISYYHFWVFFP